MCMPLVFGDLSFVVFALGIICGALAIAGIMNAVQAGIVLLVIGCLVFVVGLAGRGLLGPVGGYGGSVGNRGVV